jgi:hypothetical protein
MNLYRPISFILMAVFAATGLIFLFIPEQVITLFNNISSNLKMSESPVTGLNFYLILAVGYIYIVTLLAFLMFRHPENKYFPQILTHAKIASSVLSLALFIFHAHYLIYITNCFIDGFIGGVVIWMYVKKGRASKWVSF